MRATFVACLTILVASVTETHAQTPLREGDRLRLRLTSSRPAVITGRLTSVSPDTIWLRYDGNGHTLGFPRRLIDSAQRSAGMKWKRRNVVAGMVMGAIGGLFIARATTGTTHCVSLSTAGSECGSHPITSYATLVSIGATLGGLVGLASTREQWEAIRIDR